MKNAILVTVFVSACTGEMMSPPSSSTAGGGEPSSTAGGGATATAGGGNGAAGGTTATAGGGVAPIPGPPGCGLTAAAFCDTFDAPVQGTARAKELDGRRWSLSRVWGALTTAMTIGPATVTNCRGGLPARVYPPNDTLVCDPTAGIASRHLLVAAAAQNYGTHALRIRRPFDFAGRTGKIVLDTDATSANDLVGWLSVSVTDEPIGSPSFSQIPGAGNSEGGIIPKNGVEVHLMTCPQAQLPSARISSIHEFRSYADHLHRYVEGGPCIRTQRDRLNRLELRLSQSRIEVWGTNFSADGTTFDAPILLGSANLGLTFTRGYVHLTTHNHASMKYSNDTIDAVVTRWDNVGFDGPVIDDAVEFEVPDALVSSGANQVDVGWLVPLANKPEKRVVTLRGVEVTGATSARLAFTMQYLQNAFGDADFSLYGLEYKLNGGPVHRSMLTAGERALLESGVVLQGDAAGEANPVIWGALGQVLTVPVSELRAGDNTLEIAIIGVPDHIPATLANIDLIVGR